MLNRKERIAVLIDRLNKGDFPLVSFRAVEGLLVRDLDSRRSSKIGGYAVTGVDKAKCAIRGWHYMWVETSHNKTQIQVKWPREVILVCLESPC